MWGPRGHLLLWGQTIVEPSLKAVRIEAVAAMSPLLGSRVGIAAMSPLLLRRWVAASSASLRAVGLRLTLRERHLSPQEHVRFSFLQPVILSSMEPSKQICG